MLLKVAPLVEFRELDFNTQTDINECEHFLRLTQIWSSSCIQASLKEASDKQVKVQELERTSSSQKVKYVAGNVVETVLSHAQSLDHAHHNPYKYV